MKSYYLKVADMKTRYFVWAFSLLLFNFSCSERKISDNEKNQALQDYTACTQIADQWLFKLDCSDYNYLLNLQLAKEINKDSGLIYINNVQNEYGKIKSRRFIGAHMWTGKKLLTYAPDIEDNFLLRTHMVRSEDGFYIVDPKYFGLASSAQMFAGFPKGNTSGLLAPALTPALFSAPLIVESCNRM